MFILAKIYRYISFESFIDLVLRKNLTFVHPSLLEDPYELYFFHERSKNVIEKSNGRLNYTFGTILTNIIANKLYIQSWTSLEESDALWRIYSHKGTSVRISTDREKIDLLDDVRIIDVNYVKNYEHAIEETVREKKDVIEYVGMKRDAFYHEQEVRLVKHYRFSSDEDTEKDVVAFLALNGLYDKYFENIEIDNLKEEIDKLAKRINQNIPVKTQYVCFEKIENFIESVTLNPFAPEWVNETLKIFCKKNDLEFLGKSKLYDK